MKTHRTSPLTPSSIVFSAAQSIADDMREEAKDVADGIESCAKMIERMAKALKSVKNNLEKHAIHMYSSKNRKKSMLAKRIRAINATIAVAHRLQAVMELTVEDIRDIMSPFRSDPDTEKILEDIMGPSDEDLKKIEEEGEEGAA